MYDFSNRQVNIDSSATCTLECPKCQRRGITKYGAKVPGENMPWEDFLKIAEYFKGGLTFCGQISDPIFHPKMIEMLKHCYNNNIPVEMHTAASHKSKNWYENAFDANRDTKWFFGIDGLPEDSHKYRINQDGKKLFEMVKLCAKMGLYTRWQYIVFKYNENDIETCRKIAQDNNIIFNVIYSGRWRKDDIYKPENPKHYINGKRDKYYNKWKLSIKASEEWKKSIQNA
tara:strand:- start:3269 stop:3955 length:687 start_codon:yes stop_codon:yes gene_type:complete